MPGTEVGGVSVRVNLDDRDALNELNKLNQKIEKANAELNRKRTRRDSIAREMEQAEAAAERARQTVKKLQTELNTAAPDARAGIRERLTAANAELRAETANLDRMNREWQKLDAEITAGEGSLNGMTEQAGQLKTQVEASSGAMAKLKSAAVSATKSMQRGFRRLGRMISRVFWFSTILRGLRAIREYLGDLLLSFPEIRQALSEIKGNLLTAAQPIFERLIPAAQSLLNILVTVSAVLADIIAKIFGTTAAQAQEGAEALNEQADAYKDVGAAAKKAGKQLASFDELNVLNDNSSGSGSGASATAPSFDFDFAGQLGTYLEGLELLTGIALLAIGAILTFSGVNIPLGITLMALGAAAIYSALSGDPEAIRRSLEGWIGDALILGGFALLVIGAILAFSGANIPLGIALMVIGAAALAAAVALNWDAIKEKLQGSLGKIVAIVSAALLVLGAVLTFSGANIPLGIALMVIGAAGLAAVVIVNWDTIKEKLKGPIGKITAIVSAALLVLGAILTFSGANIPLGIALMVIGAAGLAAVIAVNWDTIKEKLKGPIGKITAIVSAALLVLGAVLTFSGANIPLGIALMAAGAAGLAAVAALNWDKIKNYLKENVSWTDALVSGALLVIGIILVASGVMLPLGIALIAAGAAGLVTVTALNWNAIKEKISETWDGIRQWWQSHVAPVFTREWWAEKFQSISDGLKQKVKDGVNAAIELFNSFIDWINQKMNISWKGLSLLGTEVIPAGSFQLLTIPKIPLLAQGAVIPPNREFMAVLGDQKSGVNVETPLSTMIEAFKAAMNEGGYGDMKIIITMDGVKVAEQVVKHINRSARSGGKLVIV